MKNFSVKLINECKDIIDPLVLAIQDPVSFKRFMARFGWEFPSIPQEFSELLNALSGLSEKITALSQSVDLDAVSSILEDVKDVFEQIESISNLTPPDASDYTDIVNAGFLNDTGLEIVEYLVFRKIEKQSPKIYYFLLLTGVLKKTRVAASGIRKAYQKCGVDFQAFKTLFESPNAFMTQEYDWGSSDFKFSLLANRIGNFLYMMGLAIERTQYDSDFSLKLDASTASMAVAPKQSIDVILMNASVGSAIVKSGLGLAPIQQAGNYGMAVVPILEGAFAGNYEIDDELELNVAASLDVNTGVAMNFLPGAAPALKSGLRGTGPSADISGELLVQLLALPVLDKERIVLLGNLTGTHLGVDEAEFSFRLTKDGKATDVVAEAELTGGIIHIDGGDGDGFLSRILPEGGLDVDFDLLVGFSTLKGFYFSGSASLEVEIPIKKKIGNDDAAINFDSVTLRIGADESGRIKSYAATSFSLMLGPLTASIDKIGMRADLDFPGSGGNLGPIDADIDFKFPNGVGITVDSDSFTGGGFLNFDKDKGRYVGGLELSFSKFSLAAVGIITTKLPDGEEGYSLLLVITAEFNPVQIGLGFTLNGVGGLLALHRTMKVDELRKGIKENTLESILFPKEIVKNASRIISDMERVFPIKKDRFVFGPMGKIGWGTPTLVTIDLGLMIEVPKPVTIAVLGILRAQVPPPGEDNEVIDPMLVLQINFLGVIEFEKKEISFDASLFDSKIQDFPLEGDMALRIKWGETPNFLMSIGGFNNSFVPPPLNLPELRRLSVNFSKGSDAAGAEILAETYFAITSNTLQFGADIYAKLEVEVFKAEGAIGFHALFQFDPFQLQANAYAWFSLAWGGKDVATVSAELSIKGPGRWKVNGSGEIYTPIWSGSGSFEAEFGKEEEQKAIEPIATWPILEKALAHKDNWVLDQPKYRQVSVAIKEVDAETENPDEEIRIHPFGQLKFIQSQMPLNFKMKQYGNSGISDYDKFWIDSVTDGVTALEYETVEDFFAPAQFTHLSDDDKLSSPSFEKFEGGLSIGTQKLAGGTSVTKTLGYEPASIDRRKRVADSDSVVKVDTIRFTKMNDFAVQVGKKNPRRTPDLAHDGQASTRTKQGGYVAAKKADSSQHGSSSFATYEDAKAYVQSEMATNPSLENQLFIAEAQEILELV